MIITEETKTKLKTIFDHFGKDKQYEKLLEEIFEMVCSKNSDDMFEEMTDMVVVLLQFLLHGEIKFNEWFNFKIDRTIERIESGYYEKDTK